MNFKLNTDAGNGSFGDLVVGMQKDGTYGFQIFGGHIRDGLIRDREELCQVIRTELLLFLNENINVWGRGMDWFGIFGRSKIGGLRELQQELSRTLLSINTIKQILSLDIVKEVDRHYRIVFRVQAKNVGEVAGDVVL